MQSLYHFVAPPSPCGYLPNERWSLEYEYFLDLDAAGYYALMKNGWRRFGGMVFRPRCPTCRACQSIRVRVPDFTPSRSQRRAWQACEHELTLQIGEPQATKQKLKLYDRFHAFQADFKNWPQHPAKDAASYRDSFVQNPFPTEEWCYYLGADLVAVGYVDVLPEGLSAIYFFYEPNLRALSPGIFNVLNVLREAKARHMPFVYLGYFVEGCRSLEYKATFRPNEVLGQDGTWHDFRD